MSSREGVVSPCSLAEGPTPWEYVDRPSRACIPTRFRRISDILEQGFGCFVSSDKRAPQRGVCWYYQLFNEYGSEQQFSTTSCGSLRSWMLVVLFETSSAANFRLAADKFHLLSQRFCGEV